MHRPETDRNLLFGIIALQMDFITRDALVAAMHAWVLEKQRALGEILVERGALDPTDRDLLDTMVDRHVARHGGDPLTSLASLGSAGGIAADLGQSVTDHEILVSIAQVTTAFQNDPHANQAHPTVDFIPGGVRYQKVRDHAKGGLGIVFVARDKELNRDVALKEIKPEYADHVGSQARFLIEAEITGGLEHPGIVPVYGLGHYDDGRPYYAMRFIRGDSLKEAISSFHHDPALKKDPGARALALQKMLRRFLDVCNAIAYAHSRGILHRDLKPDNVMVGRYGETLVVDWGLAKALGRSGESDKPSPLDSTFLNPSSSGSAETLPGSVVGTPGYMSPEQAGGRLDLLGPASDVYSLGATLYTLLTGRVPFADKELHEVLRKVERGEFPRPRVAAPWLDPALEAICLKAMALSTEARYASPRVLAEEIERWLADEPVAAYREPLTRRARRWAGRNRTALATATTAALVAITLLGGFAWQRMAQRQRTDASARASLDQADRIAAEARSSGDLSSWIKAVAEARRAQDQLDSGGGSDSLLRAAKAKLEALQAEENGRRNDLRMIADIDEARMGGANLKDGHFDADARLDAYRAAFRAYGIDVAKLPVEESAEMIRSSRIVDELISAIDDWVAYHAAAPFRTRLEAIARAADTDPVRIAIRDAVARQDASALRLFCEKEEDRRKLGTRLRSVFQSLVRLDPGGSFPLLEAIRREKPSDFWLNHDLGMAFQHAKPPRIAEAVRCYSMAVALRPDSPGAHINLGSALNDQGKVDEAIAEYQIALRMKPDYAEAHSNLAVSLGTQGKLDEAIAECRTALRWNPSSPNAHINLGLALALRGQLDEAIAEDRTAIRLKPDDARGHTNLCSALSAQGKADEAIAEGRTAIRLDPHSGEAHANLGLALDRQGKIDEAVAEYQEAIRLKPDLAEAHSNLGIALSAQGKLDEAIAAYREAIRSKPDFAGAHSNLGLALSVQGKVNEAIAEYREAIRLKPDLAEAHTCLGSVLSDHGKADEAIAEHQTAIRLKPDYAEAHTNLGLALSRQGKIDEAIAEYREAIRLKPDLWQPHSNLGNAMRDQGKLVDAVVEYRIVLQLRPDLAGTHYSLASLQRSLGKDDEALAEYRIAIQLKPDYAEAYCNLGEIQESRGLYQEALKNREKGHALGSSQPGWRFPSETWVRNARRLVELESKLPAILHGEVKPQDVGERLILATMCYNKGLQAASVRFWDEAFTEQPALLNELAKGHRYNAACAASLAGSGSGKDDPAPDEAARVKFREKALGWLRADLTAWSKVLDGGNEAARKQAVSQMLAHWKEDADLAGIRDEMALAKLPDSEREAFRALWADVDRLLAKAQAGK
jgi:eukaryotic-like serine/threonine-protein kinase